MSERRPRVAAALAAAVVLFGPAVAAAGNGYAIKATERLEVEVGAEAAVSLTIVPAAEHSISQSGPLLIELAITPAEGLRLHKRRYRRADAADERADAPRFDLRVRGAAAGSYRIELELAFWVCRRWSCWPVTETRQVAVRVRAPAPPDAGVPDSAPVVDP